MQPRYDDPTEAEAYAIVTLLEYLDDDLLKPNQRKRRRRTPTAGHCFVMTEAFVLLFKWLDGPYRPARVRMGDDVHWYIVHEDGRILDPTADQFARPVPYESGRRCWFPNGSKPSKRALELLRRASFL